MNEISGVLLLHLSLIYIVILFISMKKKERFKNNYFIILILTFLVYSVGYGCELLFDTLNAKLICIKFQYIGISFMPTAYIFFIIKITNYKLIFKKQITSVCFIFSGLYYILVLTNSIHNLIYVNPKLSYHDSFHYISFEKGILYNIFSVYIIVGFILPSVLLMFKNYSQNNKRQKTQISLITAGTMSYMFVYFLYICDVIPGYIDPNPYISFIAALFFCIAIFKYGFLGIVTVAHKHIYNSINQAVIIYDLEYNLVDYNPSAGKIFDDFTKDAINQNIFTFMQNYPSITKQIFQDLPDTFFTNKNGEKFHSTLSEIISTKGKPLGKAITISKLPNE